MGDDEQYLEGTSILGHFMQPPCKVAELMCLVSQPRSSSSLSYSAKALLSSLFTIFTNEELKKGFFRWPPSSPSHPKSTTSSPSSSPTTPSKPYASHAAPSTPQSIQRTHNSSKLKANPGHKNSVCSLALPASASLIRSDLVPINAPLLHRHTWISYPTTSPPLP